MENWLKVLHLEKSTADSERLGEVLRRAGIKCTLRRVDSRDSFLKTLTSFAPEVILADHAVGNFSAEEAIEELKALGKELPFIVVTSPVSEQFAVNMFRKGATDYILKENLQELPEALRGLCENVSLPTDTDGTAALEKSDFEYFFRNSLDAFLLTHPDGRIFAANPAACQIFQMTEKELISVGRAGIVDHSDPQVQEALKKRHQNGKISTEIKMIKKDGSKLDAELTSSIYTDSQGKVCSLLIIRDVSDRKEMERELKRSKKNYESLFRNSPLPNWIYDNETLEIIDVNEAAVSHYGYTREEFLRMTLLDIRPKEEISALHSFFKRKEREERLTRYGTFKHLKKNGSIISVEVYGYMLDLNNRKCRLVVCIDITEQELFLHRMEEKTGKLKAAQRIAKLGSWEYSMKAKSLTWNEEVYKIWELPSREGPVSYQFFLQSVHPEDRPAFLEQLNQTLAGDRKELHLEHRIILADGTVKWVIERGKLFTDKNGKSVFEGTVQDITEPKAVIANLQRSEARHRAILQSQTNYLLRTDLEGKVTYCNNKYTQDFSWTYENNNPVGQIATFSIKEYHHDQVKESFRKSLKNVNEVFQVEIDKVTQDGVVKSTLWDLVCLTDASGTPIEVQAVGIDITDRVKTKKLLEESNSRYELVSKATSDAIWDLDCSTGKLNWGEGFSLLFGHRDQGADLNYWLQFLHPEDAKRVLASFETFIKGSENKWSEEYRYKKANGEYAYVIDSAYLLRDENHRAVRVVGALNDITGVRNLQDLLDKASRLARIGSFEYDLRTEDIFWSPTVKEIFEVSEDYVPDVQSAIAFFEADEDKQTGLDAFKKAIKENRTYEFEGVILTAKGKKRWVKLVAEPEMAEDRCIKVHGSIQDIDKIKEAEIKAVQASREKETILESIGDAFCAVDQDWVVTYWNRHAEKLLNCSKEEVFGKNLWDVFPDALKTDFFRKYKTSLETMENQHFESYYERIQKWFEVTTYPSASGLSIYFIDVTERKKASLELQELNLNLQNYTQELVTANKGLEQFSYIVSHNLRSPVANIMGLGALLEEEDYPQDLKETLLKELLNNVNRLDNIIRDLNEILEVKGFLNTSKEQVVLADLVESVTSGILLQIRDEQVAVETDFEVPVVHTVLSYLHSIFYNLVTNSIKYRRPEEPPKIYFSSRKENGPLVILYRDNGLGIDLETKKEQIFGLYKRFHQHVEGKGMGLFMVKTQVELLGGKISVSSELGKGTEFKMVFKDGLDFKESP